MSYSKLINFRWLECRWFLEGFNMVISLTHTHWNSLQLDKPRFGTLFTILIEHTELLQTERFQ